MGEIDELHYDWYGFVLFLNILRESEREDGGVLTEQRSEKSQRVGQCKYD